MAVIKVGVTPSEVGVLGASDTVRITVRLLDPATGKGMTGVAFDAAGMVVEYAKGAAALATFPTFGTDNWAEIGRGLYALIIRGSDATERALLDTEGLLLLFVDTTATTEFSRELCVVPADAARDDVWTDARAAFIDASVAGVPAATLATDVGFSGGTDVTAAKALQAAWVQGGGKWALSGTTLTLYEPDGTTVFATLTLDSATAPTSRTP